MTDRYNTVFSGVVLQADLQRRMDDLDLPTLEIPDKEKLRGALWAAYMPITEAAIDVNGLVVGTSTRRFDNLLGIPAMVIAGCAILLLIVSTVKFEDHLPLWLFYPIVVVGLLPVVALVLLNYLILSVAETKHEAKLHEYWKFLWLEYDKKIEPHRMQFAEARARVKNPDMMAEYRKSLAEAKPDADNASEA